jgi:tol-pal system protein YbgF
VFFDSGVFLITVTSMSSKYLIRGFMAAFLAFGALSIAPAHAGLFGESDEEKAARQHEKDQDASIADLNLRLHDLEQALSRATGDNEALSHQVQVLSDKLERQKKDFEYRLCTLSAQQLGAGQGDDQTSLPCSGGSGGASMNYKAPAPPPPMQQQSSGIIRLAPPPGVLGTLPAGTRMATAGPAAGSSSKAQFDAALNMLAKARYDDARASFRSYADANPDDELAPQAVYWIGDIAYVQKDYADAARAFAEQIKKYPTSSRGPDSMLKLGQSLIAMGQTKEGCMTLGALPSKYPAASKTVTAQAAAERKTSCH